MNQREKTGLTVLGTVVGGYFFVWPLIESVFVTPVNDLEARFKAAQTAFDKAEESEFLLESRTRQLAGWRRRSLPADELAAQSEYMEWLTELARLSGFRADDSLKIKPGAKPSRTGAFAPVQVEIEGRATLKSVSRFLHYFHQTDLAHRVVSLDLKSPATTGTPELEVVLVAEGLSVSGAARDTSLFPATLASTDVDADQTTIRVDGMAGFERKLPFRVRMGTEFASVTAVDGINWTVRRGIDGTASSSHAAGSRIELVPTKQLATRITQVLKASDSSMKVESTYGFPIQPGFQIRVDDEELRVTAVNDREWTVERGIKNTTPVDHSRNAITRLEMPWELYEEQLLALAPFVKPQPPREYQPRFTAQNSTVDRGDTLNMDLAVEDFNPDLGDIRVTVGQQIPEGLRFDEKTGKLEWTPGDELPAGDYELELAAYQGSNGSNPLISGTLRLTLRDPNQPPQLVVPETMEVFQGQALEFQVSATDPEESAIAFRLSGDVPPELSVDASTGNLKWTVPMSFPPGEYSFEVVAEDGGSPAMSTTGKLNFLIKEDISSFVYLVACIFQDDRPECWLFDRTQNKTLIVRSGEEVRIGSFEGAIEEIGKESIVLRSGSQILQLPLGENLASSRLIREIPQSSSPPDTDADPEADPATTSGTNPEQIPENEEESGGPDAKKSVDPESSAK